MTKPFLKWAGSKRKLASFIIDNFPKDIGIYYEPFLGSGAVFFEYACRDANVRARLSDANKALCLTYEVVKHQPEALSERLCHYQHMSESSCFYDMAKEVYNSTRNDIPAIAESIEGAVESAARFIYLNKACYNGLWRENKKGGFNVPAGNYKKISMPSYGDICECSKRLKQARINVDNSLGYVEAFMSADAGDFIYVDPPYHGGFVQYVKEGFSEKDQADLAERIYKLVLRGVNVLVSNSNTPLIRSLYEGYGFNIIEVTAPRRISCNAEGRKDVTEFLIKCGY